MSLLYKMLRLKQYKNCVRDAELHYDIIMDRKSGYRVGFVYSSQYGGQFDTIFLFPQYKEFKMYLPQKILDIENNFTISA